MFDWAATTRKGVLLFVDEADAFLRRRSTEQMSEELRNALNAFLYRTGAFGTTLPWGNGGACAWKTMPCAHHGSVTPFTLTRTTGEASDKYMVVFASNQPEQFDWAINDRIDEMVDFNLPGEEERLEMVTMYLEKYVLNPPSGKAKPITVSGIAEEEVKYAAKATVGFSGREISKLAIAWQAAAYGASGEAVLNKELYLRVLEQHLGAKKRKEGWQAAAMASLAESAAAAGGAGGKGGLVIDAQPSSSSSSK